MCVQVQQDATKNDSATARGPPEDDVSPCMGDIDKTRTFLASQPSPHTTHQSIGRQCEGQLARRVIYDQPTHVTIGLTDPPLISEQGCLLQNRLFVVKMAHATPQMSRC